jgi:uncharacterized membrane protein (UPF0127 family)
VEGALFLLNSHACISQCLQNQRHVLDVLFIDLRINKDIIEVGEDEYIEVGA